MKTFINRFFVGASITVLFSISNPLIGQVPLGVVQSQLEKKQARYDASYELALQVNQKIKNLQIQYNENELIKALNSLQQELQSIEDWGAEYNRVKRINSDVDFELTKYNDRVRSRQNQTSSNQSSQSSNYQSPTTNQKTKDELAQEHLSNLNNDINLKNYESAAENCTKLIALFPDQAQLFMLRASIYDQLTKYPQVVKDLTSYIQIAKCSPDSLSQAYVSRGLYKSKLNDHYGALDDYDNALEIYPGNSMAHNNKGWEYFLTEKYHEALFETSKAIELDNNNSTAWDSRAEIKLKLKDYAGSISDCERAVRLDPNLSNSYLIKGKALIEMGKTKDACRSWSKAGELGKTEAYEYISKYCK